MWWKEHCLFLFIWNLIAIKTGKILSCKLCKFFSKRWHVFLLQRSVKQLRGKRSSGVVAPTSNPSWVKKCLNGPEFLLRLQNEKLLGSWLLLWWNSRDNLFHNRLNQFFLRCFRDPIWVPRIANRLPRIRGNHHWVTRIENRAPRIRVNHRWVPRIRENPDP